MSDQGGQLAAGGSGELLPIPSPRKGCSPRYAAVTKQGDSGAVEPRGGAFLSLQSPDQRDFLLNSTCVLETNTHSVPKQKLPMQEFKCRFSDAADRVLTTSALPSYYKLRGKSDSKPLRKRCI